MLVVVALPACARAPAVDTPAVKARPPSLTARPDFEGWMLAPDAPAGSDVRTTPDGRRLFILRGIRWIDHPDGAIERSREVFQEEDVKAVELPPRLGGGFAFYVTSGSVTLLWRAQTWTGDLRPLARIDPPVNELESGFDRLYLASTTTRLWRALDARSGEGLDLLPLPVATAYGQMVFADPWTAVVLSGVRGPLATFDAGESWYPLRTAEPVNELALGASGNIVLGTDRGRFELDASGKLLSTGARGGEALFSGAQVFGRYPKEIFPELAAAPAAEVPPLGRRPLRAAVLRGWPDTPATAVVIERGILGRVRLSDGKVLSAEPLPGIGPCRGIALGLGFGFACGDAFGPTEIYAYRHGRLTPELSLGGPHTVRSSGNGALVISAPCDAVQPGDGARTSSRPARVARSEGVARYCARQVSGELLDVRVRGELGSERIAVLRDGRVAVLIPPRSSTPGRLSIISETGTLVRELELEPDAGPGARLVRSGLWLDELWELGDAELGGWVVGAQAFVGVRVDLEGSVQIARLQEGVDETSFFGPRALHMAASASLRETTDYGFDWRVSALPPAVLVAGSASAPPRHVRGCSAVGCVYDDWVRIGFSESDVGEPARPEVPVRVGRGAPAFSFWTLQCEPSAAPRHGGRRARGSTARRAAAPRAEASEPARRAGSPAPESSAWLAFQGEPAPERRAGARGYDFGEVNENGAYRAYAWGAPSADWSRSGMWQVRVGDRFSLSSPWSTSATRSAWPDAHAAAQAFGLDPNTGVDWWLRLAPTGEIGVLALRARSESFLHLIERDRSITTLEQTSTNDIGVLGGAQVINDRWYLGSSRAEEFHLYRVNQNRPELVASYPLWSRVPTQLIGSAQGDELGIWQKGAGGWYVYPLDLDTFEARAPVHVPIERLGSVPPACEPGQPGWLGVAGVPLTDSGVSESNTHLDFSGAAEGLRTKRLTARVVIAESGICVDALAAVADGSTPHDLTLESNGARIGSLPLVVTDPTDERRWAFRCSP